MDKPIKKVTTNNMTTIEKFKDMKFKNEYQTREHLEEEMADVLETIKKGGIYATVASVSSSGMSRRIKFYRIKQYGKETPLIENVTAHIGWLLGYAPIGQYATVTKDGSYNKHYCDTGIRVDGCGMDMIFHTLYNCMVYDEAKNWNQSYRTL